MLTERVRGILFSLYFILTISTCIDGSCNFPSQFQNSSWWDSTKGLLTFTVSSMSGWKFNAYTSTVNTWECWNMMYLDTNGYFIVKSTDAIYFFGVNYYAYLCLKMTKVTDYSYYYYQQYGQQLQAYNERVYVINDPSVTDVNIFCKTSDSAKGGEFHVLLKQGKEADAKRDCPTPIRGNFDYIYYGADNTTACNSSSDKWVVCNDGKTMTFNYSTCNQRMAYSAGGIVWCVASVSGSSTFVVVYNNDTTVDDVNTFRFTCFAVSSDSSKASMISKNCEWNQTSDTMPTRYNVATSSTVLAGAILNLTAYVLCPAVHCDFPVVFRQSSWIDSGKGDITFTNKSMSGWTMTALGQTLSNWECWNDTLFISQGYLLLRSIDTISSTVVYYTYTCMKLTKVTDYSYYYYMVHAREALAGQERVLLTNDDSVTDFSRICDTSNIEPMEQFHMLVKSGYQAQAKQDCPNPIRGNFDYVYYDANGMTACANTSDKWQVCIDNKTMTFDYTTCSQLMAYSTGGSAWCVASVTKTNTYVMVYNSDTTVDNSNTYRFACFAISQNSNSSSLSPKNCSESQTPESFAKDQSGKNTGARLTMAAYASCISQEKTCTFPSDFRYSVWQDSTKGVVSFTNSTMSGWNITTDGHTVNTWKCLNDTWFETKGILVLKLQDTISGKVPYYAYMCMKLTKLTANSYYYYLVHGQEPSAAQERVLISVYSNLLDADTICDWGNIEPKEQFHVLLRSGYEASSKQDCPDAVLGNFDYIYYNSNGSVACQNSADRWDVCKDNRTMTFNYTTCSQRMAYSAGGTVWCVGSISSTYTYVVVYNNDSTVDDTNTFRFTCFAISSDGKNASMVPRNCTANQTPYDFPKSAGGSPTGAKLYMTAYDSCFSKERTDACEFASKFQNSAWRDSTKGDLTFSNTTMSGWSFVTEGRSVSNWRCFAERVIGSQKYLILKLTDTISGKDPVYAYLCLRMTHQSDYSVYYYQAHGQEFSAGQERLLLTINSSVPDTNQICETSNTEPIEQFHVLLKSGYESTAKQNCPNAIRGNFDYVYYGAGGSVACNTVNGKMEVCTDNKTMVFNYTRCNQTMAYSSSGKPWCVASVSGKYTYVVVYNNDSTVNGVETRRFSCFAISSDGKNASMVPNNCTENQTPYEFPKSHNQSDTGAKLHLSAYASCRETSVCSFPDSFKNTVWRDSTKGNLTFTNSSMSGWYITAFGRSISNWECYDSSYFATYGYLVFRSTETISSNSLYYAYLCMRLTRVTDYSYYYYLLQAQVYNAGQERVYLSTDSSVSNFSLLCDTRNVEPLEQFHMLIRAGFENVTKQDCPNPIRGNFDYVYNGSDGTIACTAAGDSWNVCIDNQTMYFNYTSCNQRMAYSDGGIVWCVAAVSGTYTYVMVYNNDSIVDQNTTHRFSCLTVSSNGTSASHVPRNCTQNQKPDTFAVSHQGTNTGYKVTLNARATCREESKCTLPSNFKNSVWHENMKGDLQFTASSMYGWSTTVFGQTVRNWECLNSTLFDSQGYLIFRLTDTISWNVPYYAYMCMKLTKLTDYSYYYYLVRGQSDLAGQERILVSSNGSITDFTSLCVLADIEPVEEFHVLIKSGFESSARQDCPNAIRGNFDYVYYGSDGSTHCSSSNDQWIVCRDNKTMTFNYTTCNQTMAHSSGGNVWCVASVSSGYTYLIVYNNDTYVDDVATFRFTCFAISTDGKNASVVSRNCSKGQTPFAFAKGSNGSNVGAKLTMAAYQTCAADTIAVNLPTEIQNSVWYDGTKGNLTFGDKALSGWGFTVFGHTVSNWELIGNYFDLSGFWIFRLTDTISGHVPYYAYLCMKPTRISNYSYYYYQVHAQESSVEGERILLSSNGTLRNKDQICDSANIEPTEQFHIIVKIGSEQNARQDCPNPLRGKFKYVYYGISGNIACNSTNGELDVCTSIQIMSFNYTKCSQQVAYTGSGKVWCMASVNSGHSYTIVYNTDPNVDDNSTFRFSCIAVSSDSKYASVVPKHCRGNQTPDSFAKAQDGSSIGSKVTMNATDTCGSTSGPYSYCEFPSQFMNSAWHDSTKGNLTFTNTTMSGWVFSIYGHTVKNWKCWDSTRFETQGYLVMKLTDTISAQTQKFAYMCMKMTKLSNNSYYYYLVQAQNPLAGEERIVLSDNDTLTDISVLCNIQNIEPKEQFHVLVKSGFEQASKQDCPNAVRGNFDYTYRGSDNIIKCDTSNDRWTVCQDNQTMKFDYSTCIQQMAYSSGGVVWCVASIIGSYTYVMVYNNDSTVDNVKTFRFTCFAVTNNGTSASMAPRNCTQYQSPTAFATSHDGSNIGATLTMSAYETCHICAGTCNSSGSSSDSSKKDEGNGNIIGIVLGVIFGILLIVGGIVAGIYLQKRKGNVQDYLLPKTNGRSREDTVISLRPREQLSLSEEDEGVLSLSPIFVQSASRADAPSATGFREPTHRTTKSVTPPLLELFTDAARSGLAPSSTGYYDRDAEYTFIYSPRMPNEST